MKIHFYGTAASEGVPAMFCNCEGCCRARKLGGKNLRTRTSCGVDEDILIDFCADTLAHTLYGGLDMRKIDSVLLTHAHTDHLYAIDMMGVFEPTCWRPEGFTYRGGKAPLAIYGSEACERLCEDAGNPYPKDQHPYRFTRVRHAEAFMAGDCRVTPIRTAHDPREECFIYVLERGGKTLLWGLDSRSFPEEAWRELLRFRFDCVVLDCTSALYPDVFDNHMSFADNVAVKRRMLETGAADASTRFIASHFAHIFAPIHEELLPVFEKEGIEPAYDGMEIEL